MDMHKGMFGDLGRPTRQVAMQQLIGAKMVEETLVKEHVLKIIRCLNELETLCAKIDTQTRIDIILNLLSMSFTSFRLYYNMNQINFSMSELMSSL